MNKIAVIGAGSWGTTLACLLADNGHDVTLWVYEKDLADRIQSSRENDVFLPGYKVPDNLNISNDLEGELKNARYILSVVPSQHTRAVFKDLVNVIREDSVIISASKGIEIRTLLTVSEIFNELTGKKVTAISGPSFAKEVIEKKPTAVTIASEDKETGLALQKLFSNDYFRVYTNTDVMGAELGGALKNVMAIASGISDGLGLGSSSRAALITRGLAEMTRLGLVMGAKEKTFGGLSGLGDLVLTCTGTLSRNYTVGHRLGKGERIKEIVSSMRMVAEGVATSGSAYELSQKHGVEMPIVQQIYKVINEDKYPVDAVRELMTRSLKSEY
ncbi:MAG TPA: NAD(P)-dependent glycerol-3-phosphate dehydrogenase [Nitrospirae bacterium]|nr:glycerol-3-phosphate dehydrogenase [NAD(P)+] [bacterium BMS3Bbin09]HDN95244.1 NAD(P)-dependent glycerol-3-phosphate dehydrogenase [Nitrospirota bacterium]HDZ84580.1 NAD(P)-dependent glycerol-3-phosphate dehydrogenase [Nitrospirota bacterium]